jgi:hypothetical protein
MDAKLRAVAAALLDDAADSFANHGCNDFDLSRFGLTIAEMREVVRAYHRWNGDPEEAERYSDAQLNHALGDFSLMRLLAAMLRGKAAGSCVG